MDVRKEEEMFRFLFIEGNAYHKKQLAELLGMKEKYFYDKFYPKFKKELAEQIDDEYVASSKRKKFSYTRLKYDAYLYNENVLMAFYRQHKALRPIEIERITDILSLLAKKAMTKEEVVREVNKRNDLYVTDAFSRSFDRSFSDLEKLGVIYKTKEKKPYKYQLDYRLFNALSMEELCDLYGFIHFISNTTTLSVPGYIFLDIVKQYLSQLDKSLQLETFSYKYINFGRILDEYKCMQLLYALQEGKYVSLRYYPKGAKQRAHPTTNTKEKPEKMKLLPLKIVFDHQYGRWYFLGVHQGEENYRVMKMEGIADIDIAETIPEQSVEHITKIDANLKRSWLLSSEPVVNIKVKFYFDAAISSRNFIKERVERQGQWGKIVEETADTFIYEIDVNGTMEIKPWIRSFGSSAEVLAPERLRKEFIKEWTLIAEEYGDV